jgi:hypothetical protein
MPGFRTFLNAIYTKPKNINIKETRKRKKLSVKDGTVVTKHVVNMKNY